MGLPNTAENPALMPHMMARSWNSPAQARPLAHQLGQGAPHLQGSPSRLSRAPKAWVSTVAQNTTGASRRETGCSPPGSLDDQVGPPGGFDAAPAVHPHHHQPRQGGEGRLAQAVPLRSTSAQARSWSNRPPGPPTSSPTPSPKSRPWPLSRRLSLLKAISVYSPRKKAVTGLPPLPGGMVGLCHNCPLPFLSKVSHLSIITQWAGFAMAISPRRRVARGAPCGKMGDGWRQPYDTLPPYGFKYCMN